MKYLRFAFFFAISFILFSCSNTLKKTFEKYPQITTVYTNNLQKTNKLLDSNIKVYPLPANIYQLLPDQAILLWDSTINNDFTKSLVKISDKHFALYLFIPANFSINSFINYLLRRNPKTKYIVTDKPEIFKTLNKNLIIIPFKISDTNIYKTFFDKSELIFAFATLPNSWPTLKKLKPLKIQDFDIIFNPYSSSCDFVQFLEQIETRISFEQILTNNVLTLKSITSNKFNCVQLNDTLLDKKLIHQIESGEKIIVYLKKHTFNSNFLKINKLKSLFYNQNLYEDEYCLIIFSNYLSDTRFTKTLKNFSHKFKFQTILTNRSYILKRIVDTSQISIINFNNLSYSTLKHLKLQLDKQPGGLVYFPSQDSTQNDFYKLNSYFNHYTKFKLSDKAYLYISPFLYDTTLAKKVRELYDQYKFNIIYSTKVYTVKFYLSNDSLINQTKILWFPYYLSAINKKPEKNFVSKLQKTKLSLFSGKALVVYFKDPSDSLFLPYKKIKQLFDAPLLKKFETSTGIVFYSSFLDTNNIKTFKKIIGNDTNKYIFTNNVPFLRNILNYPAKRVSWLPYKCILPTCALNTQLQKKLSEIRINIILDSALIIYFRDPTDSIFPSERELKEAFKFLNFVDFKKGFIIKSYEGH